MALINGNYVFVEVEELNRGVDATTHPVETGIELTDNVQRKSLTLSVSGKIVNAGNVSAKTIKTTLAELHKGGKLVKYQGREILSNALITSFKTSSSNEVAGGYIFEMEIKEIRIAKSAYKASAPTTTTTQEVTPKPETKTEPAKRYYTVKSGDCPWSIAVKYYGNGTKWEKMMKANTDIVARNKKRGVVWYMLYAGDKLLIPYL